MEVDLSAFTGRIKLTSLKVESKAARMKVFDGTGLMAAQLASGHTADTQNAYYWRSADGMSRLAKIFTEEIAGLLRWTVTATRPWKPTIVLPDGTPLGSTPPQRTIINDALAGQLEVGLGSCGSNGRDPDKSMRTCQRALTGCYDCPMLMVQAAHHDRMVAHRHQLTAVKHTSSEVVWQQRWASAYAFLTNAIEHLEKYRDRTPQAPTIPLFIPTEGPQQ